MILKKLKSPFDTYDSDDDNDNDDNDNDDNDNDDNEVHNSQFYYQSSIFDINHN